VITEPKIVTILTRAAHCMTYEGRALNDFANLIEMTLQISSLLRFKQSEHFEK